MGESEYREQAETTIADLRARVSHYEALLVAVREETLTKAALAVDHLFINVRAFEESYDRGYRQGVQDSAYAVRELRALLGSPHEAEAVASPAGQDEGAAGTPLETMASAVQAFVNSIDEEAPVLIRGGVVTWESMIFTADGEAAYRVNYASLPDTSMASTIGILNLGLEIAQREMLCDHDGGDE